ncbi:MAG: hypothetical protein IJY87_01290 [Bacilli bacterium]|nr:hypothetical protein [Bacilli bacterium]
MDNILYLDDFINLYSKKNHALIILKPYRNTLRNGMIIDRHKFIKKFQKIIDEYNLGSTFFNENIFIVINNLHTYEDKILLKDIMEELNYKNIKFIQETEYLKLNKDNIYINYNNSYFYILYINELGKIEVNLYKKDDINNGVIKYIIKSLNAKNIILYGKNIKELENILKKEKIDYYFYDDSDNLLIKFLLHNKKV